MPALTLALFIGSAGLGKLAFCRQLFRCKRSMHYICRRQGQRTGRGGQSEGNCLGLLSRFCADSASASLPGEARQWGRGAGHVWAFPDSQFWVLEELGKDLQVQFFRLNATHVTYFVPHPIPKLPLQTLGGLCCALSPSCGAEQEAHGNRAGDRVRTPAPLGGPQGASPHLSVP